tara:strand:- start:2242 stop:2769 length:528 start_codon:yes stop_codon:yes gene_type:complete
MFSNKIVPDVIDNTYDVCLICMDENNKAENHNCRVCVKNSWKICKDCADRLEICPVCRTAINPIDPQISHNIIINININNNFNNNNEHIENNNNTNNTTLHKIFKLFIFCLFSIYLGKIITFTFCSVACSRNQCEEYNCTNYITQSYWGKLYVWETIMGGIIIAVFVKWLKKLRE